MSPEDFHHIFILQEENEAPAEAPEDQRPPEEEAGGADEEEGRGRRQGPGRWRPQIWGYFGWIIWKKIKCFQSRKNFSCVFGKYVSSNGSGNTWKQLKSLSLNRIMEIIQGKVNFASFQCLSSWFPTTYLAGIWTVRYQNYPLINGKPVGSDE